MYTYSIHVHVHVYNVLVTRTRTNNTYDIFGQRQEIFKKQTMKVQVKTVCSENSLLRSE